MEWLNFHHLRYFWTVARKGSVRKAAEELHVSQPSISAQLRLLEESFGQKLFRRGGRNLVLNEMVVLLHHKPSGMKRKVFRKTAPVRLSFTVAYATEYLASALPDALRLCANVAHRHRARM
jgi:Bacterial regulatory helix-turn-helix protein, lysR family